MKIRVRYDYSDSECKIIGIAVRVEKDMDYWDFTSSVPRLLIIRHCCDLIRFERINHCKAYLAEFGEYGRYILVRSYNTIVGVFDKADATYYSLGAYSMTTYQHERKAVKAIKEKYCIKHYVNLYTVDNFAD